MVKSSTGGEWRGPKTYRCMVTLDDTLSDVKSHDSSAYEAVCVEEANTSLGAETKATLGLQIKYQPRWSDKVGEKPGRRARVHCFWVQEQQPSHHASLFLGEESETGRFFGRRAGKLVRSKQKRRTQSAIPPPRERLVSRPPVHACAHIRAPIPSRIFLYAAI